MLFNITPFKHAFGVWVASTPPLVGWLYTRTFLLFSTEKQTLMLKHCWNHFFSYLLPYGEALLNPLWKQLAETDWQPASGTLEVGYLTTMEAWPSLNLNKEVYGVTQLVMIASCNAVKSCAITCKKENWNEKILPLV